MNVNPILHRLFYGHRFHRMVERGKLPLLVKNQSRSTLNTKSSGIFSFKKSIKSSLKISPTSSNLLYFGKYMTNFQNRFKKAPKNISSVN